MSIFAFICFVAAFILAVIQSRAFWWIPALILLGIVLALVINSGTVVTLH